MVTEFVEWRKLISKAWRAEGRKRQGRIKCKPGSKSMPAVESQKG